MTRADLPRVCELLRQLADFEKLTDMLTGTPAMLERALFDDPQRLEGIVAERDGRIVGYALFHYTFSSFRATPRLWLEDLFVDPIARGTGAGDALVTEFCRIALERGCHRVDWDVLDWNPARQFYERLGASASSEGWTRYGMDAAAMRQLVERTRPS
ncbi:MAG: GNAT family N-acetyltransferase [Candidatus Eisenbacteria bacterium]|uniref:GNAT family N-acetyltransferase n=1 Tax=Eiseniibacteriota bacterium TaxID=2212470 RepID=A0A849SNZ6_UNCEI|nr:GNAT family N-acetyltransferase [Candidatus Eisenbacteria bacterium]